MDTEQRELIAKTLDDLAAKVRDAGRSAHIALNIETPRQEVQNDGPWTTYAPSGKMIATLTINQTE